MAFTHSGILCLQQVYKWHQAMWCNQYARDANDGTRCHPERSRQTLAVGPGEPHETQQGQVQGLSPGSWHPSLATQAGGCKDLAQPCQKGLGDTGEW